MAIVIPLVINQVSTVVAEAEERELHALYDSAMAEIESKGQLATAMSYLVSTTPEVQQAFANKDREQLSNRMVPVFGELKSRYAVRQFQFHLPPATSFLRAHKPQKFGDDLSGFRKTVLAVNNDKSNVQGLEKGVAGLGIRGIVPVNYNNNHIGSVEMGMSFGQPFFDAFKNKFNVDIALYVARDGNYELFGSTLGENAMSSSAQMGKAFAGNTVSHISSFKGEELSVYLKAVNDFSGKPIGVLQIAMDRSHYISALNQIQYSIIIIGLIALGIGIGVAGLIGRSISLPIRKTADAMNDIAEGEGDLTRRLNEEGKDELTYLSVAFNRFAERVHDIIQQVGTSTQKLGSEAERMMNVTRTTTENTQLQQSETEQVATAMNEMAMTVQQVAQNASEAAEAAKNSNDETSAGKNVVNGVVSSINSLAAEVDSASQVIKQLESESEGIGSVLDVIRGIAEQTNLLALNAAIEAARAGDQGRGFAVVADEVRTLASRTQKSTEEIQSMIERLQAGTQDAVRVMASSTDKAEQSVEHADRAGKSLETISNAVNQITDMNFQIATAAEEQGAVAEDINRNVNNINDVVKQTSEGARQISDSSDELTNLSSELQQLVSQFKTR